MSSSRPKLSPAFKATFTSEIRRARARHGLSTTQVAHRLGTAQSSVVRMEKSESKGAISLSSLARVGAALGCRLEYRLVPDETQDRKESSNGYSGLPRLRPGSARLTKSKVAEALRHEEVTALRSLTPEQRIMHACSLSDTVRSIGKCFR
jgi:transcriptional regulator with XRE-family HTH domain